MKNLKLPTCLNKIKLAGSAERAGVVRYFFTLILLLVSAVASLAQVGISNSSITPDASSILELRSTSAGFLPPRMSTVQRNAISSAASGLLIYNTDTNQLNYFNGSIWQIVNGGTAVTSVSVTNANGVSGVVANPTTTPAISLALGAITPSSVAATGTVTGSNLSGTNTGDQSLASLGAQAQLNGNGFVKATGTTLSYVPVLPVANGGTNSSTALNNNRVMVSSGGSIVEAPVLTNGQLLIGSTGAAPAAANITGGNGIAITNTAGGITISNAPIISEVSSSADITTTSTSDVVVTGMSITPGAGDYLVFFSGSLENTNANKQGTVSIYSNGVQIAASEVQSQMPANRPVAISTNAYITGLGAGQAIDVRWNVIGNTGTFHQRTLIVQRVK